MRALRGVLFLVAMAWSCLTFADNLPLNGIPEGAKLIQEIDCSQPNKDLLFIEYPAGISKVETILGRPARTLSNKVDGHKFFGYRVGEGLGLKPGAAYLLSVEYPEDQPRTIYICNWGCETALGFATGRSLGDVLKGKYVPNNPESLNYPLSGKWETWTQYFHLHDRFPEVKRPRGAGARPLEPQDGFWVIFAQTPPFQDPLGAGTAVATIRLYELPDPEAVEVKINYPPDDLPRRRIFSREEMADGVVQDPKDPLLSGVRPFANWYEYKMRAMKFLGINTFTKDLLEFGHNQGWDSAEYGGNDWVYQSSTPELWEQILERAAKLNLEVLPYYEYRGSVGGNKEMALAPRRIPRRLDGGQVFSHIEWLEQNTCDIVEPETIADFKKMLDLTINKYKDKAKIVGAWVRMRPTAMPISFTEANIRRFSQEANDGNRVTRSHLQSDKALLDKYYAWWFNKRRDFLTAVRDHIRPAIGEDAFVLYTNDTSEPGRPLPRSITGEGKPDGWQWMQVVATDDFATWEKILADHDTYPWFKPYDINEIIEKNMHLRAAQTFTENWDAKLELNHATPPDDPLTYKDVDGVMLSYTYNRLYTVGRPETFEPYRNGTGLTLMRHYSLNENEMTDNSGDLLGYFIIDVERAGPYCMMAEARAMAYGDPTHLGSLTGNSNLRGFPAYVRRFHQAFLALPALPSTMLSSASSDPEVVVREIKTDSHGTYYSVVNTSFNEKKDVVITLPAAGKVRDAAVNEDVAADNGKITLTLYPAQLRAFHVQ